MANEQEELRLTVNLADNASAGLAKLNEEIKQLGSGASQQHVEKFKRETSELTTKIKGMTGEVGEAFKGLGMLRSGLAAGAAGLALFGFEIMRQSKALIEYADKIRTVNQQAREFGVNAAQLKDVTEQLQAFGVSGDTAVASIGAVSAKIAELQRQGSQLRQHMLEQAGPSRAAVENMSRFLDRLTSAKTVADQLNTIREGGEQVYRHALEQTHSEQEAANRRNKFFAEFGYDARLKEAGQLQNLTKEEQALADQRQKNAEALSNEWGQVVKKYETLVETMKQPFIPYLLTALKMAESVLTSITDKVNEIEQKQLLRPDKTKESIQERFGKFGLGVPQQGPQLTPEQDFQRRQQLDQDRRRELMQPEKEHTDALKKNTSATEDLVNLLKLAVATGGGGAGAGGGIIPAAYSPGGGGPFGPSGGASGMGRAFGGGGYANLGQSMGAQPYGSDVGAGSGAGAGATPAGPPSGGAGVPGGSRGGSAGITAPAGTPIQHRGMATVTTSGGRKFQVDERFAQNFQGFISDYEKAGGVIGPESGTLGHRPHNASGHPIGAAIDINQVGYGIRGRGGRTLDVETENALAAKWGLVSGETWRRKDTGHFGIRSVDAARQALIDQGVKVADSGAGSSTAVSGGGADYLRQQRAPLTSQLEANPQLKKELAALGTLEHESDATAVVESLYNRTTALNEVRAKKGLPPVSLSQMMKGGFYGPVNKGLLQSRVATLERDPERMKKMFGAIDAAATSNLLKGATDQGSGNDPNVSWPGGKVVRDGETYNDWGGGAGHEGNRLFRERQQASIAAADRAQLDRTQAAATKVEGTGKISVDVNAPKGTNVGAEGGGLFKKVEISRQTQMSPAKRGPEGGYATEALLN